MENHNQAFKAVSRICLNNWHYIDEKVLSFNESINFFTGHSGSGKSTVIDALQILLYASTDGRAFFNKAAADDSDRSLIEYLRGMINIGENGQAEYKRNRNFSTTIVMELEQTFTHEREGIGILFDVDTASNEYSRLFFWHRGGIPENHYRIDGRAMTIGEWRSRLNEEYEKDAAFYTTSSERFRRNLYDIYLGGLDMEKFPRLFKRAIPFKMNIRLEDFVREYICMEQDIHIEEMQESVILYGRMRRKIEDTRQEIEELEGIRAGYGKLRESLLKTQDYQVRMNLLQARQLEQTIQNLQDKAEGGRSDLKLQEESLAKLKALQEECQAECDEINRQIAGSGYGDLEAEYKALEEHLLLLERSARKLAGLNGRLKMWEEEDISSNQMLWDIRKFLKGAATGEDIARLKRSLKEIWDETEKLRQENTASLRAVRKESDLLEQELLELHLGKKSYPKELEAARLEIRRQLGEKLGREVQVRILADLLDIRDEKWRNAVEGYLGNNKLALIVEPEYVQTAMEIFESLDSKRYARVSLVDTQRIAGKEHTVSEGSLAQEVEAREPYVRAYMAYLLGNVIKCENVEELRRHRTGVTAECLLYQNYQLRRLNPDSYTRKAFIGEKSMRSRQKELKERLEEFGRKREELEKETQDGSRILEMEFLNDTPEEYLELFKDVEERAKKEKQRSKLLKRMEEIGAGTVDRLKEELLRAKERQGELEGKARDLDHQIYDRTRELEQYASQILDRNEELAAIHRDAKHTREQIQDFESFLRDNAGAGVDSLLRRTQRAIELTEQEGREARDRLVDIRSEYLKKHPNRSFSASSDDNGEYENLLQELACDQLKEYEEKAYKQARTAVEHFKEDFVYKIRSAIREAFLRRDELNRIIRNLNFGKDKYQFKITRNRGAFGEYFDMFMDESLTVDPSSLTPSVENQMNLFALEHENKYGTLMNDLIRVFLPPENAGARELEEARRNMEKYADYRTYLSFEMEQIVEGEERLVISLSKMIRKNSGGEGQNPLYVALLASFAQAYHINLSPRLSRGPTIRLVILDEAFSKMDAEKVASCIRLIRDLGFQAIISATNDKIQNYLENVDKTFVYANPDKKSISIQEFEKRDFGRLAATNPN